MGLRILVVDDNEDAAEMLARTLIFKGHEARMALDGPSALKLAAEFLPVVAVLDIGLPEMDGYELAARLLEMPELSGIRLVAVTGHGLDSDRKMSADAGFHAHLVKPIDMSMLENAVNGEDSTAKIPY